MEGDSNSFPPLFLSPLFEQYPNIFISYLWRGNRKGITHPEAPLLHPKGSTETRFRRPLPLNRFRSPLVAKRGRTLNQTLFGLLGSCELSPPRMDKAIRFCVFFPLQLQPGFTREPSVELLGS